MKEQRWSTKDQVKCVELIPITSASQEKKGKMYRVLQYVKSGGSRNLTDFLQELECIREPDDELVYSKERKVNNEKEYACILYRKQSIDL